MTVQFTVLGEKLDASKIAAVEKKLGIQLPKEYRDFLLAHNVAIPERNKYETEQASTNVSQFLGVSENKDDDLIAQSNSYDGRLPTDVLPIALAGGGNLICLNLQDKAVFFWDHEQEANEDEVPSFDNMTFLAPSLKEFLVNLQPDLDEVHVNPDDVISVKVAPGFNEKFKDYLKKK
ncbi:MAG: SMI1/KNR4 family protein [Gammaproteobacteria bacterium]|nr:SMI1/KNR4 family protein [Gammaproteobacteria bacterium]